MYIPAALVRAAVWGNFEPNTGFRYVDKGRFSFHDAEGSPWETIYVKNTQSIDQEAATPTPA